ncbi:MAG: hypothetical protein ACSHX8_15480 [Opitutaceae bacterium]
MEAEFIIKDRRLPNPKGWTSEQSFKESRMLLEPIRQELERQGFQVSYFWKGKPWGTGFDIIKEKGRISIYLYHHPELEKESHFIGFLRIFASTTLPRAIWNFDNSKEESLFRAVFPEIEELFEASSSFMNFKWMPAEGFESELNQIKAEQV